MTEKNAERIAVLLISSRAADHQYFQALMDVRGWKLLHAYRLREALESMAVGAPPVVILEEALADCGWGRLFKSFPTPPKVIVLTSEPRSRAPVGAICDVLARPLQDRDVAQAILLACSAWTSEASAGSQLVSKRMRASPSAGEAPSAYRPAKP